MIINQIKPYRRTDGFYHEKLMVLPQQILHNIRQNPISSQLYPTDIGYFPHAKNHYRERPKGCEQHILLFCIDGKGSVNIEGRTVNLNESELLILPRLSAHHYIASPFDPWSIYWIHFAGYISDELVSWVMKKNSKIQMDHTRHSHIIKQFHRIYQVMETGYSMDNMIHITGLLHLLLTGIHQKVAGNLHIGDASIDPVTECIDFMLNHINESFTLDTFSELTHLSKSYLISLFKEQTGFSPIDYFIHLKIQKACQLLDTSQLPIKEIAATVGYRDSYYFSRIFKKIMATTPSDYRRTHKG